MPMTTYTEDSILSLASLDHIRLRAGMYIGRLGDGTQPEDGIYTLFKEVVDNALDEFVMGYGKTIDIQATSTSVCIRDYGRGIPLGKVIDCVSKINTGAKYQQDVFHFSRGLNGVGLKAVNALSQSFTVRSIRNRQYQQAHFLRGVLMSSSCGNTDEVDGTWIEFTPDEQIFGEFSFQLSFLEKQIRKYTYLHPGLRVCFNNQVLFSEHGLLDLLQEETNDAFIYPPIVITGDSLACLFTHTDQPNERYFSFVNGQETRDGGAHVSAFKEGFVKGVGAFFNKTLTSTDIREGVSACIAIQLANPIFESQTKVKLGNTQIRSEIAQQVKTLVVQALQKHKQSAAILLEKIKFNAKTRKNLQFVKQELKSKEKRVSYKIPKLRDCKFHYTDNTLQGEASSIFITEGESASASILASRNPLTQAVFSLRGKPMNVFSLEAEAMYKNDELFYLASALGIKQHTTQKLRYNRVILATDADVDGMHIRNLLITFFLKSFLPIVQDRHLFILETPLFKVRNKETTLYCYSEQEKQQAIRSLSKKESSLEVTRFKGLGEISPKEFKAFIGADIRLTPVLINSLDSVYPTLQFYMGKNTKERKQFIFENLIADL